MLISANGANWEVSGYRFAGNKLYGIRAVHRLAYSQILILIPAFLAVLETFSNSGIDIGTTLVEVTHINKASEDSKKDSLHSYTPNFSDQ